MLVLLRSPVLLLDPGALLLGERRGLALRVPTRNRHADGSIVGYAADVAACARVTNDDDMRFER